MGSPTTTRTTENEGKQTKNTPLLFPFHLSDSLLYITVYIPLWPLTSSLANEQASYTPPRQIVFKRRNASPYRVYFNARVASKVNFNIAYICIFTCILCLSVCVCMYFYDSFVATVMSSCRVVFIYARAFSTLALNWRLKKAKKIFQCALLKKKFFSCE